MKVRPITCLGSICKGCWVVRRPRLIPRKWKWNSQVDWEIYIKSEWYINSESETKKSCLESICKGCWVARRPRLIPDPHSASPCFLFHYTSCHTLLKFSKLGCLFAQHRTVSKHTESQCTNVWNFNALYCISALYFKYALERAIVTLLLCYL